MDELNIQKCELPKKGRGDGHIDFGRHGGGFYTVLPILPTVRPRSRIHSKSMHGYPYKSMDIQMDINKSMDN